MKDSVKDSEIIYKQFVEFEERAAAIYLRLASRFSHDPELSSFWLDMAMHEKQHAGLLQFCLCDHLFASDLPATDNIQRLAGFFMDLEQSAADPNITREQAFSLAILCKLRKSIRFIAFSRQLFTNRCTC